MLISSAAYHDSRIAVIITSACVQTSGSDKTGVARKKCIEQPDTHENGALRPIRRASGFWSNVAASGSFVDAQKSSCMGDIMGVILGEDGFKYFESIGAFVNAFFIFFFRVCCNKSKLILEV